MPKRTGRPTRNGAVDSRETQNGKVQHDEQQSGEVQRGDAQFPDASERLQCRVVSGTHPSLLSESELNQQCEFRAQRRSGPGGQHRNKTSTMEDHTQRLFRLKKIFKCQMLKSALL